MNISKEKHNKRLDKKWFYENLKGFENKHLPIFIDMSICKETLRYRIIFSWASRKPNGEFNPIMSCQLIDTHKNGPSRYVVPDLIFDCVKENVATDYKLYKFLSDWIDKALENYDEVAV